MKNCYEENFLQLANAISRIEQHIGLKTANDEITVNGRLNNIVDVNGNISASFIKMKFLCGENISAHRLVYLDENEKVFYGDCLNIDIIGDIIGLSINNSLIDEYVNIITYGIFEELSWNWDTKKMLFLGNDGNIIQTKPVNGFMQNVGYPITKTKIFIDIKQAIRI